MLHVLLAVILPGGVITAIYLAPFVRHPGLLPFGADTAGYVWRTATEFAMLGGEEWRLS